MSGSAMCTARSRGCSGRAEDQLTVCTRCRETLDSQLETLGALYADLLRPTRAGAPVRRSEGAERPTVLSHAAIEARSAIRHELLRWSVHHVGDIGAVACVPSIPAEAKHVRALARRYLATPWGGQLVDGIDYVWHMAHRAAYPAPPMGHVIGACPVIVDEGTLACGGKVRALIDVIDGQGYATCETCNTSAPIAWWRDRLPSDHDEWLGMTDLRWHLVIMVGLRVPVGTVHSWAYRGKLPTQVDGRGRARYHVDSALSLSRKAAHRLNKVGIHG